MEKGTAAGVEITLSDTLCNCGMLEQGSMRQTHVPIKIHRFCTQCTESQVRHYIIHHEKCIKISVFSFSPEHGLPVWATGYRWGQPDQPIQI